MISKEHEVKVKIALSDLQKIAFALLFAFVLNFGIGGGGTICDASQSACALCLERSSSAADCPCCLVKGSCSSQRSAPTLNPAQPLGKAIALSALTTFLAFVACARLPLLWRLFAANNECLLARSRDLPSYLLRPPRIFIVYRSLLI